jgi:glycosyltransferase involved in cell wall biosynthesis
VLDQTFEDFEFIIINDGSTDGSRDILERISERDDRVQLVHQENKGLIPALNRGLDMAQGKYIARMDADDISQPRRFEHQVRYLEANPGVGVVFSWATEIDREGQKIGRWSAPVSPEAILWSLLFTNRLCHPSAMMRHSFVENVGGYAEWAIHAEDYELWTRAILRTQLVALPRTLLKYRRQDSSITATKRKQQLQTCSRVAENLHRKLFGEVAKGKIVRFLTWMGHDDFESAVSEIDGVDIWEAQKYVRKAYDLFSKKILDGRGKLEVRRDAMSKVFFLVEKSQKSRPKKGIEKGRTYAMKPRWEAIEWLVAKLKGSAWND